MAAKPWEQKAKEPNRAYAAFLAFRDMGPERTLLASYRLNPGQEQAINPSGRWTAWMGKWDWTERARAWDVHNQAIRDREASRALARTAALWEKRKADEVERVYALSQKIGALVNAGLKLPLTQETHTRSEDGKQITTIIEPLRVSFRDLVAAGELSARLAAAALSAMNQDVGAMSDEELAAVSGLE